MFAEGQTKRRLASGCMSDNDIGGSLYCIGQTHCRNLGTMRTAPQDPNERSLSSQLPTLNEQFLRPLKERRAEPRPAKKGGWDAQRAPQDRTILVVDDSPFERTVIRSAVEGLTQFRVCGEASDGVEGIKKALELKPDLIIMDLAMPQMTGAEAAMVLRNAMPKVQISCRVGRVCLLSEGLGGFEDLIGPGADAEVASEIDPANGAGGIEEELGWAGDVMAVDAG